MVHGVKKRHEPGRGCSDRQSWSASRHDTGSRFSVCAESRFGRCAAGDDRKAGAITPTAAARSRFRHSAGSRSGSPGNTGQSVGRVDYPDVFEQVWREYPLRAGQTRRNPLSVPGRARLREGVPPEAMLDGVRRYARYLAATGKTGTEFVQRATTFFGPDRNFENPWLLPVSGTNNQRCVNHISEPDNEIPPGFRG